MMAPHSQYERVAGQFQHKDTDACFDYAKQDGEFAHCMNTADFPHIVYVCDGIRAARVLKTVVYIAVDEDENGMVIEKWPLKGHRIWNR